MSLLTANLGSAGSLIVLENGIVFFAGGGVQARLDLQERQGRLVVRELIVTADRVTGRVLNQIPLGRIEELLNQATIASELRSALERRTEGFDPGPTVADLPTRPPDSKVVLGRRPRKVQAPSGRAYPDEFYADVAAAFGWHSARGGSAAAAIAKEADVPVSTVHRWLKEARTRGLLAPSSRAGSRTTKEITT